MYVVHFTCPFFCWWPPGLLPTVSNAAMNMGTQSSSWDLAFTSFRNKPQSGKAGLCGNSKFKFLRNHCTIFHTSYPISHSHHRCTKVLISPHSCQNLLSVFLIEAILMVFIAILKWISLIMNLSVFSNLSEMVFPILCTLHIFLWSTFILVLTFSYLVDL
jgi:hypothetical protein